MFFVILATRKWKKENWKWRKWIGALLCFTLVRAFATLHNTDGSNHIHHFTGRLTILPTIPRLLPELCVIYLAGEVLGSCPFTCSLLAVDCFLYVSCVCEADAKVLGNEMYTAITTK